MFPVVTNPRGGCVPCAEATSPCRPEGEVEIRTGIVVISYFRKGCSNVPPTGVSIRVASPRPNGLVSISRFFPFGSVNTSGCGVMSGSSTGVVEFLFYPNDNGVYLPNYATLITSPPTLGIQGQLFGTGPQPIQTIYTGESIVTPAMFGIT